MNTKMLVAVVAVIVGIGVVARGQEKAGTTKPAATQAADGGRVDATKKAEIEAAVDKRVVVFGTVESAEWTRSGKTLQIRFEGGDKDFRGIAYENGKTALDNAFGGDFAKAITGKRVEISGTIKQYVGTVESWKHFKQVAITRPSQVKIVEKK